MSDPEDYGALLEKVQRLEERIQKARKILRRVYYGAADETRVVEALEALEGNEPYDV